MRWEFRAAQWQVTPQAGRPVIAVSIRRQSAHGGAMNAAIINYSFWALGMLALGGIVLATLVW